MMLKRISGIIIVLLLCISAFTASSRTWSVEDVPNVQLADRTHLVTNPDGLLSSEAVDSLNSILVPLKEKGLAEVAVVALESIGTDDPRDFRHRLFNHWGLGNEKADNGLLVLLVKDQGAIEIETGYGVEGLLPDALCKRVIENLMIPYFREGDFSGGMIEGVDALALVLQGADPADVTGSDDDIAGPIAVGVLFIVVLIGILAIAAYYQNRCPRCKKHTLKRSEKVLISKTIYQRTYKVTYVCTNCGKVVERNVVENTGVSAGPTLGGGSHRGGGFGGFGGGFGGGMSGGGGAGGRF